MKPWLQTAQSVLPESVFPVAVDLAERLGALDPLPKHWSRNREGVIHLRNRHDRIIGEARMKRITAVFLLAGAAVWAAEPQPSKPDKHTAALFHFDQGEGGAFANAVNKAGTVQLGTHQNYLAKGRFGDGLQFTEPTTQPRPSVKVSLAGGGLEATGIAIDFWFKVEQTSPIIRHDFYLMSNGGLFFRYSVDRRSLEFGVMLSDGWVTCASSKEKNTLAPGKWMHVAGTYDGSELRLYLDGQRVAVVPGKGDLARRDVFILGCCAWDQNQGLFSGVIDELRFSNLARTEF
jgi:hypothetical protein